MNMMKCPHCGRDLPSESSFCPYCMEQIKLPVAVSAPSSGKSNRKGLYVMILITAVLVLAVSLLLVLHFCGNPRDRSTHDTTISSTSAVRGTDDVNYSDGHMRQEEIQGSVQGETTTVGNEPQMSESDTTAPPEGKPVNNTTQNVTGDKNNASTTEHNKAEPTTEHNNSEQGTNNITTSPQVTVCSHNWVAQTKTVHHEEEGHYEEVPTPITSTQYKCAVCGDMFDTLDEYYAHFDSTHISYPGYNVGVFREKYGEIGSVYYVTTEKWVVDSEAYDEVITSYECSKCGKVK